MSTIRPGFTKFPSLTIGDRVSILARLILLIGRTFKSGLFRLLTLRSPLPNAKELPLAIVWILFKSFNAKQVRVLGGDHQFQLAALLKAAPELKGIYRRIEEVGFMGTVLLDPQVQLSEAKLVVFYIHGGAYTSGDSAQYIPVHARLRKNLMSSLGGEVGVFLLDYDLVPNVAHPIPILETAAAYNHLVSTCGVDPSKIVFSGDSAGANLLLSFLLHQTNSTPLDISSSPQTVSAVNELKLTPYLTPTKDWTPPSAIILISPWISPSIFTVKGKKPNKTYTTNKNTDVITKGWVAESAKQYFKYGDFGRRGIELLDVTADEWQGALKGTKVFVEIGDLEVFKGEIQDFVAELKKADIPVTVNLRLGGAHDTSILDAARLPEAEGKWTGVDTMSAFLAENVSVASSSAPAAEEQ